MPFSGATILIKFFLIALNFKSSFGIDCFTILTCVVEFFLMIHLQQWTSGDGCGSDGLLTPVANFSSDPRVSTFCACFLLSCANTTVPAIDGKKSTCDKSKSRCSEVKRAMASVLYECASQEKMEMLPAWIEIFRQEEAPLKLMLLYTYKATTLLGDTFC